MKRLVLAALTAAISMGAVAPAMAWGYNHCVAATNMGASSGTAIKHCAPFLAADGEISFGSHKGETWSEAFPGTENLGSRVKYVDKHAKTLSNYATGRTTKTTHTHGRLMMVMMLLKPSKSLVKTGQATSPSMTLKVSQN